jgi:hypothetical protein
MVDLTHFDPITIGIIVAGFIGTWAVLRNDSKWHSDWIKKHSAECDEQRLLNTAIFTQLKESNARLTVLTEGHDHRLERIENQMDRKS